MRDHRKPIVLATTAAIIALAPSIAAANSPSYELRDVPPRSASEIPPHRLADASGSPIHFGGGSAADTALALDVAHALAMDQRLNGATITVAANDGEVMLSGSAESPEQGDQAQLAARRVAGVSRVSGTLSTQGG
jgi:hypothetical protein